MIDITKKYRTRDGEEVRDLRTHDEDDNYPITGEVVFADENIETLTWTKCGRFDLGRRNHVWDLVEVIEEKPVEPTPEPKKDWPQFDPTKQYKTRDGRPFRYYASDGGGEYPIHGAVEETPGHWLLRAWTLYGRRDYYGRIDSPSDLIEVKPRIKREYWLNINPEVDDVFGYTTKEQADEGSCGDRIACVSVVVDCEHGEGLGYEG
jgi:hypothetical protein